MELTSVNNEKVKYWQKLKMKKYRDREQLFLIEDEHLIQEGIKKNVIKEIITIDENNHYDLPTYYVNQKIMRLLSSQESGAKVIGVAKFLEEKEILGNILILDNLQDPGNLGTIIRSAVAFNFDTIVLSEDSVDVYNPKVVRASEGMIFHINIKRCNLVEFLNQIDSCYQIVTTDVKKGKSIREIQAKYWALIIGNEGKGVSEAVKSKSQEFVKIPMNNNCESLNAAVSASILMYEIASFED